jgi:hypothetical protein
MKKVTYIFLFFIISFLSNELILAQNSDAGPETKYNVKWNYGITAEESAKLNYSNTNLAAEIPQELLDAINTARKNEDNNEVSRLTDLMYSLYRPEVKKITDLNTENNSFLPEPMVGDFTGNYQPDWLVDDILVAADTGGGNQFARTLDIKRGDDGALYMAYIVNTPSQRRIKVSKSSNGGQTWATVGGIWYSGANHYFETLSMLVESKNPTIDDSIRISVYYTHAAENNNDNAGLGFFTFKPNDASFSYIIKSLATPSTGREFNYVSAISDGQYWNSATWLGCLVSEYSNNGDTTIAQHLFQTRDWGTTHNSVSISLGYNDFFPNAAFLKGNIDSVVYVTQRHFSTPGDEVRVMFTSWSSLTAEARTNFLTVDTIQYAKPVITIKQGQTSSAQKMIITCTKDGRAMYHSSVNSGLTWSLDYQLDNRSAYSSNTNYTYITSDSTGNSGDFCAMFSYRGSGEDSINVRRGIIGNMGTAQYKQNSMEITSTHPAVTAIYRDGGNLYSTFGYWANGPDNIYFDNENLVTGVDDKSIVADNYSLQQNYPNPFNPSTTIRFSIPEQTNVTLKIFNSIGQEVASLLNGQMAAGNHSVGFNASKLSSGVYFYRIDSPSFTSTKKMILIK